MSALIDEFVGPTFVGRSSRRRRKNMRPFDEATELELAAELLELEDEAELEQFLGTITSLARSGIRTARDFASSKTGRAVIQKVKTATRDALMRGGQAVGSSFGAPFGGDFAGGLSGAAGKTLGRKVADLLGLPEKGDAEFEAARRFVRFVGSAARDVDRVAPGAAPTQAATIAVARAARRHLGRAAANASRGAWQRRGNTIIVNGIV